MGFYMLAIFLDTETTGLDPFRHRILDIAFVIIDVSTGKELITYQTNVLQSKEVWDQRDHASVSINGFTWERVLLGKEESVVKDEIMQIFSDFGIIRGSAVYICQNPAFDRNFFAQIISVYIQEKQQWPYHWLDFASMYWALKSKAYQEKGEPFPKEMTLSKNAIAQEYLLSKESIPHSAINGVNHLILCYRTVIGFLHQ